MPDNMSMKIKYVEITPLLEMIEHLQKHLVPEEKHIVEEFCDATPPVTESLKIFFSRVLNTDEAEWERFMSQAPPSVRQDFALQLSTCRLFCNKAIGKGFDLVCIPTDIALFFSEVPKEVLLKLTVERYAKETPPIAGEEGVVLGWFSQSKH